MILNGLIDLKLIAKSINDVKNKFNRVKILILAAIPPIFLKRAWIGSSDILVPKTMQENTTSLLLSALRILDIISPDITNLTLQIISAESTLHGLFRALSCDDTQKVKPPATP